MSFHGFGTYLDLYISLREGGDIRDYNQLFTSLKTNSDFQLRDAVEKELKEWCRRFCYRIYAKWMKSSRNQEAFMRKYSSWLQADIKWPENWKENVIIPEEEIDEASEEPTATTSDSFTNVVMNPECRVSDASTSTSIESRKPFEELSNKQKRRRTESSCSSYSTEEIVFSAQTSLKSSGKKDVAEILQYLLENPEQVSKVKQFIQFGEMKEISSQKALALYVTLRLSKFRYITLRDFSEKEGICKYPSYYKLQEEKKKCYPDNSAVTITETSVKIKLQALLDLTVNRLIQCLDISLDKDELLLISKWGFDGASNQSVHQQKSDCSNQELQSVFMASLVPLKLTTQDGCIIWQNQRPSSTSFCRPIMWKFMKETEFNVKNEMTNIETEIESLNPTKCENATIKHKLLLTMIDGKVASYISGTSTAVCDLCKARPKEMNNIELVQKKPVDEDMYKYGLSSLHAWIRAMECLLHIAYRLDIKSWQSRGDDAKKSVDERKKNIQDRFRKETGLLLDVVKQGSGTTNNGNSARRFFQDPAKTADITGLDVALVQRLGVILQCISSGEKIIVNKFNEFCIDTAKMFTNLYPWYYMPVSIHKLLIHGAHIIEHLSIVPIGFLSEEASEARNKDFRKFRESHSRKSSSINCNEDVLHNLLLTSDPFLTTIRPKLDRNVKRNMFKEVYEMIVTEENQVEFCDVMNLISDSDSEESEIESDDDIFCD